MRRRKRESKTKKGMFLKRLEGGHPACSGGVSRREGRLKSGHKDRRMASFLLRTYVSPVMICWVS